MCVPLELRVRRDFLDDDYGDTTSLGVPSHMVTDLECFDHWRSSNSISLPQFFSGGLNIAALPSDWHTLSYPSLCERDWLPEEGGDLLPPFEQAGFCGSFLVFRHGANTMLGRVLGLQSWLAILASMDIERTIDEIEQLEEMFEAPDIRPFSASDISAANRKHDEMLAHSPWFRLWKSYGVCCRPEPPDLRLGEIEG